MEAGKYGNIRIAPKMGPEIAKSPCGGNFTGADDLQKFSVKFVHFVRKRMSLPAGNCQEKIFEFPLAFSTAVMYNK